ncbi:MAG: DUF1565 domain-containing protein [Lentisphaerae bacterium]|nr:DUF1565 domain-containing protein [Lentisphaerota bacterium]
MEMRTVWSVTIALIMGTQSRGQDTVFPAESGTIPVAGWDVVPHQIIREPFLAGVVAFHETSVSVQFGVRSGSNPLPKLARNVAAPSLNPRTGVWEYVFKVDPRQVPAGPIHLTAVCIPEGNGNRPITLPELPLHAAPAPTPPAAPIHVDAIAGNDTATGTRDGPVRTLAAGIRKAGDGGTVLLAPGTYSPDKLRGGKSREYWTTIQPAEGATRDEVRVGRGRPGMDKLRFRNVAFVVDVKSAKYYPILSGENGMTEVWLDNCEIRNLQGRWAGGVVMFGNRYRAYVTGGVTTEIRRGPGAVLMRDHRIVKIAEDVFTDSKVVINSSADGVDAGPTGGHADFHQSHVGKKTQFKSGVILYNCSGVNCKAQGFFGHNLKDSAFVNCLFEKTPDVPMLSQYSGMLDHVLFLHLTLPNQSWLWRGGLRSRNCFMLNCILPGMSTHSKEGADVSGVSIRSNHFLRPGRGMGTDISEGDPGFAAPGKADYRLSPESSLCGAGRPLPCVPVNAAGEAWPDGKPNRGCF